MRACAHTRTHTQLITLQESKEAFASFLLLTFAIQSQINLQSWRVVFQKCIQEQLWGSCGTWTENIHVGKQTCDMMDLLYYYTSSPLSAPVMNVQFRPTVGLSGTLRSLSPDQPFYNFGVWKMNLAFNYFGSEQSLNCPMVDSSFTWPADPEKKLIKRPADEWVPLRISSCSKLVLCLQPSALWLSRCRQQRKNRWKEGFWIDRKNLTAENVSIIVLVIFSHPQRHRSLRQMMIVNI